MPLNVRKLRPELAEKALKELNEVPERTEQDLEHIKEWLKKQPHIRARTDDQWLLAFLRGCKFSLERTKKKLDAFYTSNTFFPEYFKNKDPFSPEVQRVLSSGVYMPLPNDGSTGPRPILMRVGAFDLDRMNIIDVIKTNSMICDILICEDDDDIISGEIGIFDYEGAVMGHVALPPRVIYCLVKYLQDALPIRSKEIHCINVPPFFDICYSVAKLAFNKKTLGRVFLYTKENTNKFYEKFNRKILPAEYGGDAGTISDITAYWKEKVESYADWYKEENNYYSIEELRPDTETNAFGVGGSFRKLSFD